MLASASSIIKFFTLHSALLSLLLCTGIILADYKKLKNRIFSGLLFAFSINNAYFFLFESNLFHLYPFISAICFSGIFLIGPMVLFFSLISINQDFRFSKISYLHFLPFLLSVVISLLSVYTSGPASFNERFDFFINKTFAVQGIFGTISFLAYLYFSGYLSVKYFISQRSNLKKEPYMMASLLIFIFFIIIFLIDAITIITGNNNFLKLSSLLLSICILFLFLINTVFPGIKTVTENLKENGKTKKSHLDNTDKTELKNKIEKLINDEIYIDSELTLQKFSEIAGITPHQLSEFINMYYHKNFNSFINEYRIKKAKELLLAKNNYTMIAIAFESGFNSKSAFNAAFRKSENISPSEFKDNNIS